MSSGRATTIRTASAGGTARQVASTGHFVTASAQGLLGILTNFLVTVTQGTHQSLSNLVVAAAGMALELVTDLASRFSTDAFVTVIQSVDESAHDFRVAAAVTLAEAANRRSTILGVASSLRSIDPLSNSTSGS